MLFLVGLLACLKVEGVDHKHPSHLPLQVMDTMRKIVWSVFLCFLLKKYCGHEPIIQISHRNT